MSPHDRRRLCERAVAHHFWPTDWLNKPSLHRLSERSHFSYRVLSLTDAEAAFVPISSTQAEARFARDAESSPSHLVGASCA